MLDPRRGLAKEDVPLEEARERIERDVKLIPRTRVAKEGSLLEFQDYDAAKRPLYHENEKCLLRDRSIDRAKKARSVSDDDDEWRKVARTEKVAVWKREDGKDNLVRTQSASAIPDSEDWDYKRRRLLSPLSVKRARREGRYNLPDPWDDDEKDRRDQDRDRDRDRDRDQDGDRRQAHRTMERGTSRARDASGQDRDRRKESTSSDDRIPQSCMGQARAYDNRTVIVDSRAKRTPVKLATNTESAELGATAKSRPQPIGMSLRVSKPLERTTSVPVAEDRKSQSSTKRAESHDGKRDKLVLDKDTKKRLQDKLADHKREWREQVRNNQTPDRSAQERSFDSQCPFTERDAFGR